MRVAGTCVLVLIHSEIRPACATAMIVGGRTWPTVVSGGPMGRVGEQPTTSTGTGTGTGRGHGPPAPSAAARLLSKASPERATPPRKKPTPAPAPCSRFLGTALRQGTPPPRSYALAALTRDAAVLSVPSGAVAVGTLVAGVGDLRLWTLVAVRCRCGHCFLRNEILGCWLTPKI